MSFVPVNTTVWIEIPVTDLEKSMAFYETATGATIEIETMGPQEIAMFKVSDKVAGIAGHLYVGKPATDGSGPTVHLAVDGKLEAAQDRVRAAGGEVISDPIPLPIGRFFYAKDLDGNSIGLYEAA